LITLDAAVVGGAEKLAGERADHHEILSLNTALGAVEWFSGSPVVVWRIASRREAVG
jgi:hypothetical protein